MKKKLHTKRVKRKENTKKDWGEDASRTKTRPIVQRCIHSVLRYAFCDGASGNGGVGAVMVVAMAAAAAVVVVAP